MASGKDVLKWIEKYEKKAGTSLFEDWDIEFYPLLYLHEDGSFFSYTLLQDRLEVGVFSGKFNCLYPIAEEIARQYGYKTVTTVIKHNPISYARLTKSKHIETKVVDGKICHQMAKEVVYGKRGSSLP